MGIIKKINIEPSFLNKLFIALILEVVAIGVLAFKESFKPSSQEFIKIVTPSNGFKLEGNRVVSVYGAYNKLRDETLIGEMRSGDKISPLTITQDEDKIFYINIDSSSISNSGNTIIRLSIFNDGQIILSDSISVSK